VITGSWMEEISISVTIADRPYRLTVLKNEEESVKKAAKLIDQKVREYSGHYAHKDKQDLIAMVALQYTTSLMNNESQSELQDNKASEKLIELDRMLSEHLNEI
jgi:cell division protein ZapA (FtsZ GTPase activity inhibitor)